MHARFASAGHHPALIRRADGTIEPVVENGWMLGMFDPYEIRSVDLTLDEGDVLVMFTDGVIEARRGDDLLGSEAVEEALAAFSGDAYELTQHLVDLADAFADGADDDIAIVALSPRSDEAATS